MSDDIFDRALDRRNALIKEQRRRIKALEEALGPLAECAIIGSDSGSRRDWNSDDYGARYFITYGEIRRARALLKETDR